VHAERQSITQLDIVELPNHVVARSRISPKDFPCTVLYFQLNDLKVLAQLRDGARNVRRVPQQIR
jgi:hypothetical protein